MSTLPDDHDRTAHVVKDGLRDAAEKKAADGSESSGSENDEVDIAAARDLPVSERLDAADPYRLEPPAT